MLAAELRRMRESAFLTGEDLKARLGWSTSKVSRIENARIGISTEDLDILLDLYRATAADRQRLMTLLEQSSAHPWWRTSSTPPNDFHQYLDFEAVADLIEDWEIRVVPGLFQTESYARSLLNAWKKVEPALTPRELDERVALRMRRQVRLNTSDHPLRLDSIVDESVLLRRIGDATVMHAQLARLLEISELPNVTLRVLPLDADREIMDGSFMLIKLSPGEEVEQRLLYVDNVGSGTISTDDTYIYQFQRTFENLAEHALTPERTRDLIVRHDQQRWIPAMAQENNHSK
ncbi:helix-turn-helix transcriptional regulator [Nonomuraea sp. NEAU-A123]|uniref:helix-turn-helix domain-containing protein n=1 Tax=Nonomuraea sp. NEAU-A123 TaxID=2839649 RepID=UPI001BE4D9A6|nr:helix-turn-helix transcriptional regulator [Nonomuraea sp. NEAU-A123]MBT2227020.1 helix-turn-helix domain-containing protein [Nonomuraea sp. NEAU-A123]